MPVPKFHRVVSTGGSEGLAVGAKDRAGNPILMTFEDLKQLSLPVPKFHRVVITGSGEGLAIGAKGDAIDNILMTFEGVKQLSLPVPKFHRVVLAGSGKGLAIGAKGDADHPILMANKPIALFKSFCVHCHLQSGCNWLLEFRFIFRQGVQKHSRSDSFE